MTFLQVPAITLLTHSFPLDSSFSLLLLFLSLPPSHLAKRINLSPSLLSSPPLPPY